MPTALSLVNRFLDSEAGRRQPCAVMARVLGWQLGRRGLRKPMSFKTVTGARLKLLPGASDSLSGFWYQQLPDFEELVFALHLLRRDDLFVDVGANQGGWSLTLAAHGARVISFEPVPLTRDRLLANVRANPPVIAGRVHVRSVGLGDHTGEVSFTADLDAGNHRIRDTGKSEKKTITVDFTRADEVLRDENPVVIKIDVEGGELDVLKGARGILARPSLGAVVMETFRPHNFSEPMLIAAEGILREHGFMPVGYDPWNRELRPLLQPSDGAQNTIYVRNPSVLIPRLKSAAPIRVLGKNV